MKRNNKKIIRAVTIPNSIDFFSEIMFKMESDGYENIVITSPGLKLDKFKVKYPHIKTITIPMERHISIIKDIIALFRIIKVFNKERPYMVHSMTPKAGLLCMIAAWVTRVPRRVHTFTGLVWPTSKGLSRILLMFTDWMTCFCATHIIPEGKGVKDDLRNHITRKNMQVLGYGNVRGVDLIRFSNRQEVINKAKQIRADLFTFLFVGRIVGDKGINELVTSFVKLNKVYPNTKLFLVGHFEMDLDPIKLSTKDEIEKNDAIEAVGAKYDDDLLAYYASSDCFVFPSYREGFPNTVIEAGAMGLPCIVTDINGSREIIENGINGLIVPPKSVDALYESMESIMTNTDLYKHLSSNSRSIIESRFEKSFVLKCLLNFYKEIW